MKEILFKEVNFIMFSCIIKSKVLQYIFVHKIDVYNLYLFSKQINFLKKKYFIYQFFLLSQKNKHAEVFL